MRAAREAERISETGSACSCHGSRYDQDVAVTADRRRRRCRGSRGDESTLARSVETVGKVRANRTSIERAVDRVSRVFIPVVLLIAVATFAYAGLTRAIAVLVIACPLRSG